MSTSNSTGFPITTYSIPGDADLLANERVSFACGQRHNEADIADTIELMSAKVTYTYLFYETEKRCPHAYYALSSMHTFLAIDLIADKLLKAIDSIHSLERLEYLSGTLDGKVSFGVFGTTLEDELLEWADGLGKGIFGIRREDIAKRSSHADRVRWLYEYSSARFVPPVLVTPRPDQCYPGAHLPHHHPSTSTHPVGGKIYSHRPNQPDLTKVEPLQSPFHWVEPKTTISPIISTSTKVILQIPAARTPLKLQSHMSKGQKDSPPGTMHRPETGSPSNPINVDDDAAMIDQFYAGTYDLGDDDPTTPQSDTSSNTQQRYHKGVRNNTPYCQNCSWSDHRTYYCEAYYCPDCDRRAPGHSFNWCPIRREDEDRILMEGLHGDVSYNDSYNMDSEGTKFW
ncbi:hypothetical protein SERLADRAFT_442135 [Serpula lacrymans var. lacrymans S7.9]|uniref:Uncharacterized protein n=1 Tax=Serpula lacrymans var. lacrymans (strain S7.9) TaxID=578457 RepID=F8P8N3_SERL9|nr:uncharacterized protein SERLADRAFT_442135 [Serpula lacrymans var. lacrymans S7.9]EGO20789.1 hypothetical protein SERLADRAFT_442135 [Serpula lacrymans var. lacrymans S7.9]